MKTLLLGAAALSLMGLALPHSLCAAEDAPAAAEALPKITTPLEAGQVFPDFNETDLEGKPVSIGALKGKVVLVDFWATWCGPCVAEMPNVIKAYDKFHSKGFEIIGISLDREKNKLTKFIEAKKVTWTQILDNKGKLAQRYNIQFIPSTFLIDKQGKIIAAGLRGEALDEAVSKALEAK